MDRDVRRTGGAATAVLAAALVVALAGPGGPQAGAAPPSAPVPLAPLAPSLSDPPLAQPSAVVPPRAPVRAPAVVRRGNGDLARVAGAGARSGSGPLRRYTVAVEGGLGIDPAGFVRTVERVLADERSWGGGGRLSFQRVADGPVSFRVVLASPTTTDRLCAPLRTNGRFSCGTGSTAVVNSMRWLRGAASYAGRLEAYRAYVVNHEVGHALGRGHMSCPGRGLPAPVMVQQTKGTGGCVAQPWPYP
ncbi:MAG: DUF3152 domain-containing protein [Mycobacteriales bacterium]|nr:DUF3152 domain-containing protein [Mycobacteriales bacterium]